MVGDHGCHAGIGQGAEGILIGDIVADEQWHGLGILGPDRIKQ